MLQDDNLTNKTGSENVPETTFDASDSTDNNIDKTASDNSENNDLTDSQPNDGIKSNSKSKEEYKKSDINESEESSNEDTKTDEQKDYSSFRKDELLNTLRDLIANNPIEVIKTDVDQIKAQYYILLKSEKDKVKKELIEKAGSDKEIEIPKDPTEDYLKELLVDYKKKKEEYFNRIEKEKEESLKKKENIIEKIKILANGEESLNKTFSEFKELQRQWNEIGPVPNSQKTSLWNNYQLQIERFYDFIKINKELRDLDFKKNLENKIELCEKAEDLLLESDIKKAYSTLQEYHNLWKDIGPVEANKREEIWERFSEATKKIRKAYQEFFIDLKKEREENYTQKKLLCEKVESMIEEDIPKTKSEWINKTEEIKEIQKLWKTIGMVPKEVNDEVFSRFRTACNRFFEEKKEYFDIVNEELNTNLQKKIDICVQAESIQDSKDWRKTSNMFFDLQKKWKEIGPVPRKDSNNVWKRFRKACDTFFNSKDEFFKTIDEQQSINAEKKKEIISLLEKFEPVESQNENIEKIKEIQKQWIEIGPLSPKDKDKLQKSYRDALDKLYKKLNLSKQAIDAANYKEKIQQLNKTGDIKSFTEERTRLVQKIKKIEDDIRLWENNMNFFSNGAADLLSDFNTKLTKAKEELAVLKNRKKIVDIGIRDLKSKKKD